MKIFKLLTLSLVFVLSSNLLAAETTTECPMMREMNERSNPKASLKTKQDKTKTNTSGAVSI